MKVTNWNFAPFKLCSFYKVSRRGNDLIVNLFYLLISFTCRCRETNKMVKTTKCDAADIWSLFLSQILIPKWYSLLIYARKWQTEKLAYDLHVITIGCGISGRIYWIQNNSSVLKPKLSISNVSKSRRRTFWRCIINERILKFTLQWRC